MAVQSKRYQAQPAARAIRMPRSLSASCYALTTLLAVLALYAVVAAILAQGRVLIDDVRYGRPRTTHLAGFVGHGNGEQLGTPTELMAININHRVVIVEFPGGDPAGMRTFDGPYLFGADESLTPVGLELQDVDRDGQADLLVTVHRERIVYLNREGSFRPATPEDWEGINREQP